jgi:hypothetical protein
MTPPLPGFVIERRDGAAPAPVRYYLLASDEAGARASAAALLRTDIPHIHVLRAMTNWEVKVYCPFPNELTGAS